MAEPFVYTMVGLNKYYGQKHVLKDIYLSYYLGAKIGIVGDNGAGKSTLLKIMAGIDDDFQGRSQLEPSFSVGFIPQEPKLDLDKTVRENIEVAFADTMKLLHEYEDLTNRLGDMDGDEMDAAMERMGVLQDKIDATDGWEVDTRLRVAANALVLPPDEAIVRNLSGGERRRVALCRVLLQQPDLLLLDEPTNHLDAETVDWLEHQLRDYPGTVIVSTHDRYFLDNITKWILELESGRGVPFEGNYSSWLAQKLEILAQREKKGGARRDSLERELKWIKMSSDGHRELSQERIKEFESLVARERAASEGDDAAILIAPAEHLGEKVIEFNGVTKGYNGQALMKDVTFSAPRGAIVGVIGPNGAGKTTLFRMITGEEQPDDGSVEIGETVKMAYVDQHRDDLADDQTVYDVIAEGKTEIELGKSIIPARAYVGRFNFKGSDQQKLVGNLSGGERNRVHLAKLLKSGGNVLLLDEPTNDLDVNTLRMLEDALNEFAGCAFIISHDRFFLNRVCTHTLAFEGDAAVRWFPGAYEDYERTRRKEIGDAAFENRRARYRRLQK